ncbi:MAG: hypothetical protein AABW56_04970 [Nanoarchaeota archaeon]
MKTKLIKTEGRVLIPGNFRFIEAFFLDKRNKELMNEADRLAKSDFENHPALSVIKYNPKNQTFEGSNVYSVVLLNMLLRGDHYKTAASQDLEYVMWANDPRFNASHLKGHYEDIGIALRSDQEPNGYHAKDLITQLQEKLGSEFKLPYKLDLSNLELRLDQNSPNKLAFNILDPSKAFYAPILNEKTGKFEDSDPGLLQTGLPGKLGEGTKTFYTEKNGLHRLYLGRSLDLGSGWYDLDFSGSGGRVVVVGEADAQKLKQYVNSVYNKQVKEFDLNRQKALSFLNGKK